jgi:hypothetical protein
MNHLGW